MDKFMALSTVSETKDQCLIFLTCAWAPSVG